MRQMKNSQGPFRVERKGIRWAVCDQFGMNCLEDNRGSPLLFDTEQQAKDSGNYLKLLRSDDDFALYAKVVMTKYSQSNPAANPNFQPQTVTGRIAGSVNQQNVPPTVTGSVPSKRSTRYQYIVHADAYYDNVTGYFYDAKQYYLDANGNLVAGAAPANQPSIITGKPDPHMQAGKQYIVTSNGLIPKEPEDDPSVGDTEF